MDSLDFIHSLSLGFSVSLTPENLFFCLIGTVVGTAIGVLPGLGPTATISLLLPITFRMEPVSAIIMLAGIYYGAMYGGSITSILIKIPGEAASVITCIDGYEMARRGRAGAALGISAFGSFIAGILSTLGIALIGPPLASVAYIFGPVEQAALVVLGLTMVAMVSSGPVLNAFISVMLGLLASAVGTDLITGVPRFTLGISEFSDGINIAAMAMGLFGVSELLVLAEAKLSAQSFVAQPRGLRELLPNREDWKRSAMPIARGSGIGFFLGLLPGAGLILAPFASYVIEKRLSRRADEFGQGAIEGVAGPESANNAAAQSGFVPLFSLGIPANAVMGVMLGALMIKGVVPGPQLATTNPSLFWGTITSMFIGNLMLIVLNIPLVGVFVQLLRIPQYALSPLIILFCVVGAYSLDNSTFGVGLMVAFGVIGYLMRKAQYDPAPFLIAFVLGQIFETSFRQGLLMGQGHLTIFVERPISAVLLFVSAIVLAAPLVRRLVRQAQA